MIRLVLTDCDGTILPVGQDVVSERTIAAVAALREAGIEFGPATGRPASDLRRFFRGDVSMCQTGIICCGKLVFLDGELVFSKPLDRALLDRALDVVRDFEDACLVVVRDDPDDIYADATWFAIPLSDEDLERMRERFSLLDVDNALPEIPEGDFYVAGLMAPEEEMAALRAAVAAAVPELELVSPLPVWCDINPGGWSKAEGLKILVDAMGIRPEEVVVIGDSENDLEIMAQAPNSLCVANGTPECRAAANAVIPAADQDGPAQFMEALAKTKGDLAAALALLG